MFFIPQMSPLMWSLLYPYSVMVMLMFSVTTYFKFILITKSSDFFNTQKLNFFLQW
ncbi:ATP synthase F0 subunit 8 (mitochondrion) [Priapulus caudatus]|uniref:ATP synthase F0 subunit 8 n=1 Tax=Priapulus caudatus TaxID=37621 RepID=A0MCU8_PRICU|nr:ATP synthase F0 subunit 8 [Priapulus caudatus]ABE03643.1 ATP synthase F0 subunit 8 [Priapulus caudatus]